jgi:phosphoribosylaminoimidazole-succinocarboxamide synthase
MKLPKAYSRIDLSRAVLARRGKVRDLFDLGAHLLLVASDRVSAFDVVLPTPIPCKGRVLNSISAFWFRKTAGIVPNHLVSDDPDDFPFEMTGDERGMLEGRSSLVRKGEMIEAECVVRGYLDGSGWKSYAKTGKLFDHRLPAGLRQGDRLPEPLFTPTTKAQSGHDESITFDELKDRVGTELAVTLRDTSIELYDFAARSVFDRGVIIADTKFEFTILDGNVHLADEIFTPDSSRFWDRDKWRPGGAQPSFDKQFIRDWLETQPWDKTPPAPALPDAVVERSVQNYLEAYRRVTGRALEDRGGAG